MIQAASKFRVSNSFYIRLEFETSYYRVINSSLLSSGNYRIMSLRKWGMLEVFKFAVYLAIPVGMVAVVAEPKNMKELLYRTQYIVYPPEGPKPPRSIAEAQKIRDEASKAARESAAAKA